MHNPWDPKWHVKNTTLRHISRDTSYTAHLPWEPRSFQVVLSWPTILFLVLETRQSIFGAFFFNYQLYLEAKF